GKGRSALLPRGGFGSCVRACGTGDERHQQQRRPHDGGDGAHQLAAGDATGLGGNAEGREKRKGQIGHKCYTWAEYFAGCFFSIGIEASSPNQVFPLSGHARSAPRRRRLLPARAQALPSLPPAASVVFARPQHARMDAAE
ncbi:hypothetical protein ABZP36_028239, partial [Zizania latifolia]